MRICLKVVCVSKVVLRAREGIERLVVRGMNFNMEVETTSNTGLRVGITSSSIAIDELHAACRWRVNEVDRVDPKVRIASVTSEEAQLKPDAYRVGSVSDLRARVTLLPFVVRRKASETAEAARTTDARLKI